MGAPWDTVRPPSAGHPIDQLAPFFRSLQRGTPSEWLREGILRVTTGGPVPERGSSLWIRITEEGRTLALVRAERDPRLPNVEGGYHVRVEESHRPDLLRAIGARKGFWSRAGQITVRNEGEP